MRKLEGLQMDEQPQEVSDSLPEGDDVFAYGWNAYRLGYPRDSNPGISWLKGWDACELATKKSGPQQLK